MKRSLFFLLGALSLSSAACSASPATEDEIVAESGDSALVSDPWKTGATAKVKARELREQLYSSCWATRQDFVVTYENHTLPWGTKVELHYGDEQYGNCSDCVPTVSYYPWSNPQTVTMPATGAWIWEKSISVTDGGGMSGGGFAALNFAIKITYPNGSVVWDNGGTSNFGYYRAPKNESPSTTACGTPGPWADIWVWRVYK